MKNVARNMNIRMKQRALQQTAVSHGACRNRIRMIKPRASVNMQTETSDALQKQSQKKITRTVSVKGQSVTEDLKQKDTSIIERRAKRRMEVQRERRTYRMLALSSTLLLFGLASGATWFRFFVTEGQSGGVSVVDFSGTMLFIFGGVVAMEYYARYAHRLLWHENEWGWALHESHHKPRTGPFEANDIYAVANAVPALSLCLYGFLNSGLVPSICWGAGLGITLYGWMYMFVHDGMVHRRFPVGPLAELPFLKRVACAHQIHHSEKFGGVPYGLFLAEDELAQVDSGIEELEKLVNRNSTDS